jgi:hypothetical protein
MASNGAVLDPRSYAPGIQQSIKSDIEEYYKENLSNCIDNAIELNYTLTPQELQVLNTAISPRVVKNPSSFSRTINHGVARAISDIAYRQLLNRVSKTHYHEIGIAPSQVKNIKFHACSLLDERDEARIHNALVSQPNNIVLRKALEGHEDPKWCLNGVQNCTKTAKVMIAHNSLYDVKPSELLSAMRRKGTDVVYATMWYPSTLFNKVGEYDHDYYYIKFNGNYVTMDFKNYETAYTHRWSNWIRMVSSSVLSYDGFHVMVETQDKIGDMHIISYTRIRNRIPLHRPIPMEEELVYVPNLALCMKSLVDATKIKKFFFQPKSWHYAAAARRVSLIISKVEKIPLPRAIYSKVIQFITNRKDSDVERNVIGSTISANTSRIEVDSFIIQMGHRLQGRQHHALTVSLMVIGCANRMLQTKTISHYMKEFTSDETLNWFSHTFKSLFGFGRYNPDLPDFIGHLDCNTILLDVLSNCVDERIVREYASSLPGKKELQRHLQRDMSANYNNVIGDCKGCNDKAEVVNSISNYNCLHGVPFASHPVKVGMKPVSVAYNYTNVSNYAKATKAIKELGSDTVNFCASPGNDNQVAFKTNVYSSTYMDRVMPSRPWYLNGNANCIICFQQIAGSRPVYLDYGSDCPDDFFSLTGLKNKMLVKVRGGIRMLQENLIPECYLGWYVTDLPTNGGEILLANFQNKGDEWQRIEYSDFCTAVIMHDDDEEEELPSQGDQQEITKEELAAMLPSYDEVDPAGVSEDHPSGCEETGEGPSAPPRNLSEGMEHEQVDDQIDHEVNYCVSCGTTTQYVLCDDCNEINISVGPLERDVKVIENRWVGNDCLTKALLGGDKERGDFDWLYVISNIRDPELRERMSNSVMDENSYSFADGIAIREFCKICDHSLVMHDYDNDKTIYFGSVGEGTQQIAYRNNHYSSCEPRAAFVEPIDCDYKDYYCREIHTGYEWTTVQIPSTKLNARERRALKRELLQEPFKEFHLPVLENIEDNNPSFEMHCMFGVAGSGKTTHAMDKLSECDELCVITPTSSLAAEYREKYKGIKVAVWSSFCREPEHYDNILLDEVFLLHPMVLPIAAKNCDTLYAIGDPYQNLYGGKKTVQTLVDITNALNSVECKLKCSRAVPVDVCAMLDKIAGIKIKTHSTVRHSIDLVSGKPESPDYRSDGQDGKLYVCFTNDSEKKFQYRTANKMQGARCANTAVFCDAGFHHSIKEKIPRQFYVAVTRHTKSMKVYMKERRSVEPILQSFLTCSRCLSGGLIKETTNTFVDYEHTSISINQDGKFKGNAVDTMVHRDVEGETLRVKNTKHMMECNDKSLSKEFEVPINFAINNSIYDQYVLPSSIPVDTIEEEVEPDELIHSYVSHLSPSTAQVEEVMERISPTTSDIYNNQRLLQFDYLGRNESNKRFTIKNTTPKVSKNLNFAATTSARLRGRECKASEFSQELQTALGRYSKKVDLLTGDEAIAAGEKLYNNFRKVVPHCSAITDEEFNNAMASQINRIASKKEDQDEGIHGTAYENTTKIKFFLKQQVKSDLKPNSYLRGSDDGHTYQLKAGQGISAQPKTINHVVGAWVTAAERKIRKYLDPRVKLGYGYSKAQFRAHVKKLMKRNDNSDVVICCDISEQDTSKGEWTNVFMRKVYQMVGVPDQIIDIIESANIHWTIDSPNAKLRVKHKYQSGRSDTLFANTMMNLALILSCIVFNDLKILLVQGDDSYMRAQSMHFEEMHPNLKVEKGQAGDFVGYIIGKDDIYLDIPRFIAKLLNRTFSSQQELLEYRNAVFDWLSIYRSHQQLHDGIVYNAYRYGCTFDEMAMLMAYFRSFYKGDVLMDVRTYKNPNFVTQLYTKISISTSAPRAPIM